ncbi:MAG: two pore domain potassium channel family protein [Algicola sp.]|nr:two pore domain potassium channel family protein [Algicola sp.]
MISFFLNLYRFARILFHGIKNDSEFRFLLIFIILLLVGSTFFYSINENWSILDSLYFSVMTMATIGYGDLVPTSSIGKIFTIIFTFLSIGGFVSFTAKMIQLTLEHRNDKIWKRNQ